LYSLTLQNKLNFNPNKIESSKQPLAVYSKKNNHLKSPSDEAYLCPLKIKND
jgi:hypothetical protein